MDKDADYTVFFQAEYPRVVRTIQLTVGDAETALDITQEAFARLYTRWWRISRYERPDAWVRRIAMNLAISHLRRVKVQRKALELIAASQRSPSSEAFDDVLEAVRGLPPTQRAAVILYYFEDQPSSGVAEILGCSESTARVHLHKARKKLAMLLVQDEDWSFSVAG